MDALAVGTVECIELYDDALGGESAYRGTDAACCSQVDVRLAAHFLDGTSLDDGPVHLPEVALANLRSHVREVQVGIVQVRIAVDVLAEVGVGGVGRTEIDGIDVGELAVAALARAGTGEDTDLEGAACSMLCLCLLRNFGRSTLGNACRRKTTQANSLSVLNKRCSLCSSKFIEFHDVLFCFLRTKIQNNLELRPMKR